MQVLQHCLRQELIRMEVLEHCFRSVESQHNCRARSLSISDCLHCPFQFVIWFFFPNTGAVFFFAKHLLEYAQAAPRGLYIKPKYDKVVATAYFEQEVAESHPCPFTSFVPFNTPPLILRFLVHPGCVISFPLTIKKFKRVIWQDIVGVLYPL